jgi:nitrite reductase (NADH) small subunit
MGNWVKVVSLQDIPKLGSRVVERKDGAGDIAVFRTADDKVFALRDKCPHRGGPLSQGIVHGEKVTCPLHGWTIGLTDGRAQQPDEGSTACISVKLENGAVFLKI